jgi:flagellar motility protein MotE (MotC chaperone)
VGADAAPIGAPPITDAERSLLLQLRQRSALLDAREAALSDRARLLDALDARLTARLAQLDALQARLEGLEQARQQRDQANWARLTKVYETMRPADAAAICDDLDMAVLLPVMDRMKESKAAAIMAAMDPGKARLLTINLAQYRLRANQIDATPSG